MKRYDLAIIGSGPGGYVAGLYAARHKLSVCVIEKDLVGGTCLNRGCIPTKAMLTSASLYSRIKDSSQYGIEVRDFSLNFHKVISRKDEIVSKLRTGIETLFRANGIDLIKDEARIVGPEAIKVGGDSEIQARHIIIATGSRVSPLPEINIDEERVLSSEGALGLKELPASIVIIGGGVIGCEFATLFNAFGVKVVIIELLDKLIASQSKEASKKLESILKKRGVEVHTSARVEAILHGEKLKLKMANGQEIDTEKVLVSVGRLPNTDGLGLEDIGIKTGKGMVAIDDYLRTNLKNIYAIGDCVSGPLLAHKASYEGILACDNILGNDRKINYGAIPSCIYTDPQIASVGLNDETARERYSDVKIAKFPFLASGKASLLGKTEGYIKIIGTAKGDILGVEIFGEEACDLIGEAVLAKTMGVNIKDLSRVVHGHPTLSEIFQETAHIFGGTGIHSI